MILELSLFHILSRKNNRFQMYWLLFDGGVDYRKICFQIQNTKKIEETKGWIEFVRYHQKRKGVKESL